MTVLKCKYHQTCTILNVFILGYEWVALSRVERVDVTVGVVKGAVPQVLGQLKGHLPLCQCHFLSMPYIHLTAKVKDQNLHTKHSLFFKPSSTRVHCCLPSHRGLNPRVVPKHTDGVTDLWLFRNYLSDLLGVQQRTTGHLGPVIVIWNQFVIDQAVNAICLDDGTLVQLIFVWCSCSCRRKDKGIGSHAIASGAVSSWFVSVSITYTENSTALPESSRSP